MPKQSEKEPLEKDKSNVFLPTPWFGHAAICATEMVGVLRDNVNYVCESCGNGKVKLSYFQNGEWHTVYLQFPDVLNVAEFTVKEEK